MNEGLEEAIRQLIKFRGVLVATTEEIELENSKAINPETERLLATLAEIGGKGMKEEDIVYEGTKLQLPERWRGDLPAAIKFLQQKRKEEDELSTFSRQFNYRPWDGAYNAFNAMKKAFGMVYGKTTYSFFGSNPPQYVQIQAGVNKTEEVPWGTFTLPMLTDTQITFGVGQHTEYGQVFRMIVQAPRKYRFIIEGLFIAVEKEISENSIYRGKAIDGQESPQFLDLSSVDPTQVVYSDIVETDLSTHIWAPIRYPQVHKKLELPLKRAILLQGPYGTGKSLAASVTALIAVQNKWTFIMARPGRDNFYQVMQTARLYQPAVVFMEDAETVAGGDNQDSVTQVLDIFDGIQAKGNDLMVVLTTNHPELIHEGMRRAGRLDAVIEIGSLDAHGIEKLIRRRVPNLDKNIDFAAVVVACEGYVPSFVKEVADRSIRYAINRLQGDIGKALIRTEDLVSAAVGLRPHFEWMQTGKHVKETTVEDILVGTAMKAIAGLAVDHEQENAYYAWDVEALEKVQEANGRSH